MIKHAYWINWDWEMTKIYQNRTCISNSCLDWFNFFFFFWIEKLITKKWVDTFYLGKWIIVSNIRGIWVFRYNSHMENMLFIISKHIIVVNWRKFNIECSVKYIYVFMLHSFCQSSARGISVSNLYIEIGTIHAMADRSLWSVF